MKILIVRPTPNKMNLNTYNLQEVGLAKAFTRKGHTCDVAYFGGKEKDHWQEINFDNDKKIRILWMKGYAFLREGIYPTLHKYVKEYDIIQVGGYTSVTSCMLNRNVQEKVVNYQGPYYYSENKGDIKKARIFDKTLLKISHPKNMIVATKSVLATDYIKSKGIKDVTTVGVGIDLSNLCVEDEDIYQNKVIKELRDNKQDNKYLLYIGALEDRRNILFLLEVFSKVSKNNEKAKLVLVGKGKPEYTEKCFGKIKELGIEGKVIYHERIEQKYLKAVYEVSDAFLLPTKYEIFGMVLLEAMYFGLPVFTTVNGGSTTLMNEDNGIVIDGFNEDVWAEKINEVISDAKLSENIGSKARETIEKGYTWDVLSDRFLEIYEKRLNK